MPKKHSTELKPGIVHLTLLLILVVLLAVIVVIFKTQIQSVVNTKMTLQKTLTPDENTLNQPNTQRKPASRYISLIHNNEPICEIQAYPAQAYPVLRYDNKLIYTGCGLDQQANLTVYLRDLDTGYTKELLSMETITNFHRELNPDAHETFLYLGTITI